MKIKVNYTLNADNTIASITAYPFDTTAPFIEIDSIDDVVIGVDLVVKGNLVKDYEKQAKINRSNEITAQINDVKHKLSQTDYLAIKYAEGELTPEEFAPMKAQRHAWRLEIAELEEELRKL